MGKAAFADELLHEINASEAPPEDDDVESDGEGAEELEPDEMTKP